MKTETTFFNTTGSQRANSFTETKKKNCPLSSTGVRINNSVLQEEQHPCPTAETSHESARHNPGTHQTEERKAVNITGEENKNMCIRWGLQALYSLAMTAPTKSWSPEMSTKQAAQPLATEPVQ